jgi:hypothetical protein
MEYLVHLIIIIIIIIIYLNCKWVFTRWQRYNKTQHTNNTLHSNKTKHTKLQTIKDTLHTMNTITSTTIK